MVLSIIIPALNEELAISAAIKTAQKSVSQLGIDYELILINDGSVDRTGAIMDEFTKTNPDRVKVVHNLRPKNVGCAFGQGVKASQGEYVIMVAGDGETSEQTLISVINKIGSADLIISYATNTKIRSWQRRLISWSYVLILNLLFGMRLHYFNGTCLIRRDLIKQLSPWTPGFAFMSEISIQLIKNGATYEEVPAPLQPRLGGKSKSLSIKNFILVAGSISKLIWRVYFERKK
jgi:glycosyltransferase involved in cell wall biosynthesis